MQINSDWIKSEWILNVNILTWKHLLIKPWDLNLKKKKKTSSCQCLLLNFDCKKNIFKKVYVWIIELISMNNIRYQLEQLEILTKNFSGTVNLALKLASLSMDCISIRFFFLILFFLLLFPFSTIIIIFKDIVTVFIKGQTWWLPLTRRWFVTWQPQNNFSINFQLS